MSDHGWSSLSANMGKSCNYLRVGETCAKTRPPKPGSAAARFVESAATISGFNSG